MTESMKNIELDELSRNRIIAETDKNFFVEAGAGSGKTTMLVNRMVAMVEAGIDISKICAITFTKAAAGEFRDRFEKLLMNRSNPDIKWKDQGYAGQLPTPTAMTRERCSKALENIDLCFMGTIDSFCYMILSEHPYEAGIPSNARIISEYEAEPVYEAQYVRICSGKYGSDLQDMAHLFSGAYKNPVEVFVHGITFLMDKRNVSFKLNRNRSIEDNQIFIHEKNQIISALSYLKNHPELKYSDYRKSRQAWDKIEFIKRALEGNWTYKIDRVLSALNIWKNFRILPQNLKQADNVLASLFHSGGKNGKWLETRPDDIISYISELRYEKTMSFLLSSIHIIEDTIKNYGYLSYFDCLYYLRNMLRKDTESGGSLIKYIYNRHSYFLIDEFQDTNPLQAEIFFYLTSESPTPNWRNCVPRQGSLFIVGDPKQSIYRFRGADVTSFLNVKELFQTKGGEVLCLLKNFRSTRILCEYFNHTFNKMLPKETQDQSKFESIPLPDETTEEFQGIYTYCVRKSNKDQSGIYESDAVKIADIIDRLVNREDYRISVNKGEKPRKIRYSDFMVITKNKDDLVPIMSLLNERNIPTKAEGKVQFENNEALNEVWNIYSAVSNEKNQVALFSALTGKMMGFTKEDILYFRAQGGKIAFHQDSTILESNDLLIKAIVFQIQQLKELQHKSVRLTPSRLFSTILNDFKLFKKISTDNLEVLFFALELLRDAEKMGKIISLEDGCDFLSKLISDSLDIERCLNLNATLDRVHMANLHKVKGLEASIVILASAENKDFEPEIRVQYGKETEGILFKFKNHFKTSEWQIEKSAESDSQVAEKLRLVYVAATRARNALIICDSGKSPLWKPLFEGANIPDFFAIIDENPVKRINDVPEDDPEGLYRQAEENCVLTNRANEIPTYTLENPSRQKLISKLSDNQGDADAVNLLEVRPNLSPALLGTMTHRLMELLVTSRNTISTKDVVLDIINEHVVDIDGKEQINQLEETLSRVAERIKSGGYVQKNDMPADILSTLLQADEVYCEVPFCYQGQEDEKKTIWNGVMDVVYCKDSKWHIVDYKTNLDPRNLEDKYQLQLDAYVKAFKATTGHEADATIYHIVI